MKLLASLNDNNVCGIVHPSKSTANRTERIAARAVALNDRQAVALINVTSDGYYKLPGGGVEINEEIVAALHRECREEIGYDIEVLQEIGQIEEFRAGWNQQQVSHCYLTRIVGVAYPLTLTKKEQRLGQQVEWWPLERAIELVEDGQTDKYVGKYIIVRDAIFLREAQRLLI
ncbi:MAG: NUDIX hydrolase [Patescibacteria group bacterium]